MSNGSGDYALAFSTAEAVRRTPERRATLHSLACVPNDLLSPLFEAAIEATEEAILNALCAAETMEGWDAVAQRPVRIAALDLPPCRN